MRMDFMVLFLVILQVRYSYGYSSFFSNNNKKMNTHKKSETDSTSISHLLQYEALRSKSERLVNELKKSAEEKLQLLELYDSLNLVDTRRRDETTKKVENHLDDFYNNVADEINILKNEALEIEKEITKVGDTIFSKKNTLQTKTDDDIGNMAPTSILKRKQLLEKRKQLLEESSRALEQLAEFGHKKRQELFERRKQLQQAQKHLVENSKKILDAQEAFQSKQKNLTATLDKLRDSILLCSLAIFVIYMFTKCPELFFGLVIAFLVEFIVLRFTAFDIEKHGRMINLIWFLSFVLGSSLHLYSRDYDVLNIMENGNDNLTSDSDTDSEVDWSMWVNVELSEDTDSSQRRDNLHRN